MRRGFASLLLVLLLPVSAAAQQLAPATAADPAEHAATPVSPADGSANAWSLPVWRAADGSLLALTGSSTAAAQATPNTSLGGVLPGGELVSTGLSWASSPHAYTRVGVNQLSFDDGACQSGLASADTDACARERNGWGGGEIGAGYRFSGFTVDVGANWLDHAASRHRLPTVLPNAMAAGSGVLGVPGEWVDSVGGVNARGSLRLGNTGASVNVGASIGRLRLSPESESGFEAIDQRALSFGASAGPLSGVIVGRMMQPVPGTGVVLPGADQHWSAVDLGITLRLPWEGELSVGAQNLWSSGRAPLPAASADPAQGRVPYIQYHQEL
jgi:hypothetical protein